MFYGSSGSSVSAKQARTGVPDVAIVGAPRCGTTSIADALSKHPSFCVAQPKEPFFFERDYFRGTNWYEKKFFKHWQQGQLMIDARAFNLWIKYCAPRIYEANASCMIVIIVRDPIEQMFSMWSHMDAMRPGRVRPFPRAVAYAADHYRMFNFRYEEEYVPFMDPKGGTYKPFFFECCEYASNITRFKQYFSQVGIFLYDDLVENPERFMGNLTRWVKPRAPDVVLWKIPVKKLNTSSQDTSSSSIRERFPEEVHMITIRLRDEVKRLGKMIDIDLIEKWGWDV
ncbi:hypothetical protein LCGC14_1502990 [marine sediment metagenome]|uniref:Sulfotransferase domain-containing protein n=1 Tax=marine sediment metagenome TaxID=412755 RepID=A0A0F9LJ63_9ZZZZ